MFAELVIATYLHIPQISLLKWNFNKIVMIIFSQLRWNFESVSNLIMTWLFLRTLFWILFIGVCRKASIAYSLTYVVKCMEMTQWYDKDDTSIILVMCQSFIWLHKLHRYPQQVLTFSNRIFFKWEASRVKKWIIFPSTSLGMGKIACRPRRICWGP